MKVAIGELSAIDPELLSFAWRAFIHEGPDAGCRLEVEWVPARQFCPACGQAKPREPQMWLPVCPDCGAYLRVEGGYELDLLEISFEPCEQDRNRENAD